MKLAKITSAAAALILAAEICVPAEAAYYSERSLPRISADQLRYEPYSQERMDEYIVRIDSLLDSPGNGIEISVAADGCREEYLRSLEEYRLAMLENDINYSAEGAETVSGAYAATLSAFSSLSQVLRRISESGEYSYILTDMLGSDNAGDFVGSLPSDRYYELSEEEERLVSRYSEAAWDSDASAKIYVELVKVRTEIAHEMGYESYADYAHEVLYGRDYSRELIETFSNAVAENFSGMFEDIFNASMVVRGGAEGMSETETLDRIGSVIGEINGELKNSYDYMRSNGLYNVSYSSSKSPVTGAYTVVLPRLRVPYMFVNPTNDYERSPAEGARNIIHEFGHFSALLNDPAIEDKNIELTGSFSMDTCEVHSQGLESLAESYYGRLFGSGASLERYMRLLKCVGAILDGCMFNELQTRIYDAGEVTVDEINTMMVELLEKYYDLTYTESSAQGLWTSMTHNFEAPMYYLSYAVSGMAALQILCKAEHNMDLAVDKYMKISALGGYVPFKEALEKAGFDNIFYAENVKEAADSVRKAYGIGYSDVEGNSWYEPYTLYTSHIMDGENDESFAPDENITRSDFLELIARGYDYYTGIGDGEGNGPGKSDGGGERYISWALGAGISNGYSENEFGGEDDITREQLVVMLYRLSELQGGADNGSGEAELEGFSDADNVSEWAREAMEWAVENDIINGRGDGMIEPQANATRAEAAKIEACYIEMMY